MTPKPPWRVVIVTQIAQVANGFRDLARAMTARALVEDNRSNVPGEGWTRRGRGAGRMRDQSRNDSDGEEPRFHHALRDKKAHQIA